MKCSIRQAAVIGAGSMGAAIAAHIANAGVPVHLLDVIPDRLTPLEEARGLTLDHPAVRNRIVNGGLARAQASSPAAFFNRQAMELVIAGNVVDDFDRLREADWIVEAVVEDLTVKRQLMARLEDVRRSHAVVSTNTSGIPIGALAAGRSPEFQSHFLGTHFFNPPRYIKLLEVIPGAATSPEVTASIAQFAERSLGKGVVICKDRPNFVANRLASLGGAFALSYALEHGYTVEEVDSLTGPLIGRPKTATFRLLDLIGLDVAAQVQANLYPLIPNDEDREVLRSPKMLALIDTMIERGWLGNKVGCGFYKPVLGKNGERDYHVLNLQTLEHEPARPASFESARKVRDLDSLADRLKLLLAADDRAGQYLWAITGWGLAYASRRVPEIAETLYAVDQVARWGFGHELGPFETWDALGVVDTTDRMQAAGLPAAPWVTDMLSSGHRSFYQRESGRPLACYDVHSRDHRPLPGARNVIVLKDLKAQGKEIRSNLSASLIDLGDDVACLEFHCKMNALDPDIVAMIGLAVEEVQRNFRGLVVGNQGEHFCVGANLFHIAVAAQQHAWDVLEQAIKAGQDALMALRCSGKPVVAAPFSMALGGGAEVSMATSAICAAAELYMGQVETAVGLIPAAGGCKELLRRLVSPGMRIPDVSPLPYVRQVFETIALAKVSRSAAEARDLGFLTAADRIVMNRDHLLGEAKRMVLHMEALDYCPPARQRAVYAAGRDVHAALLVAIYQMEAGGHVSAHDALVARKLAHVLCGGPLSKGQWVDEQYILDLEREAFLSLAGEPKTIERIWHMLQNGKPLRN